MPMLLARPHAAGWFMGTFSWSFQTSPYEVNISHSRYQAYTDHCVAYYCFDVVAGTGSPDALESWYWDGDGYNYAPHNPCSSDGYTPSGQNPCDDSTLPQASVPPCAMDPGVYLLRQPWKYLVVTVRRRHTLHSLQPYWCIKHF